MNVVNEVHDLRPIELFFLGLEPGILGLGVHEAAQHLKRRLQVAQLEVTQDLVGWLLGEQRKEDWVRQLELVDGLWDVGCRVYFFADFSGWSGGRVGALGGAFVFLSSLHGLGAGYDDLANDVEIFEVDVLLYEIEVRLPVPFLEK